MDSNASKSELYIGMVLSLTKVCNCPDLILEPFYFKTDISLKGGLTIQTE